MEYEIFYIINIMGVSLIFLIALYHLIGNMFLNYSIKFILII